MSPGTTRMRKNTSTATLRSVGIINKRRLTMYFSIGVPMVSASLGQPHCVQLLVQVVARRDRPSLDLRAVRDDAVPLKRVQIVRLIIQQPFLEFPEMLLALVGVLGPCLLQVQVVQHPV